MLQSIPTAALVLLNLIVVIYVLREQDRARSGIFLVINAVCLILWTGGLELWRSLGYDHLGLVLPGLAAMVIPANILYFSGSRPTPLSPFWSRLPMAILVFAPMIALGFMRNYEFANTVWRERTYLYSDAEIMWGAEGGWPLLVSAFYIILTIIILAIRYSTANPGPDRNLPRHLLFAVAGPILFTSLFSIITSSARLTIIPSPSMVMALIAQMGIFFVIRQEEVERPLYLSRWIYFSIVVLVGFLASHLIYTLYEWVTARVLLAPTVRLTILATIVGLLVIGSLPQVQAFFDRVMFSRAWEYRKLVREAQAELYDTRQRLRRAERFSVVGEMAAQIAHEIKNPLGPIKGYTQLMRERLEQMPDFPQRESFLRQMTIISEEVENIDRRVRHLLDISRKPELTVKSEDVNRIVEHAAILLRLEAEALERGGGALEQRIFIREELDDKLPKVLCNRARIEEAVSNLCRNAFEAIAPRGTIRLRTALATGEGTTIPGVSITVEDDGPGISEQALSHLFEPFYTEKAGGTGLGLSIVRTNLELHQGTVRFERLGERGTRAILWLPLGTRSDATPRPSLSIARRESRERIPKV